MAKGRGISRRLEPRPLVVSLRVAGDPVGVVYLCILSIPDSEIFTIFALAYRKTCKLNKFMSIRTGILTVLTLLLALLAGGCHDSSRDPRLARIAASVSDRPEEALASLDSINRSSLSKSDSHYYDLLTVKARDKAYIDHESDSLVLDVIDYYSSRPESPEYPEALYYGGRVYSDLGDYPSALRYFQLALDRLPPSNPDNLTLRSSVLSQTGSLLNLMRLYDQAVPYLEEALSIYMSRKDSLKTAYDLQLLGAIRIHTKKYSEAESSFLKSIAMSKSLPESFRARCRMYLARIKESTGDMESALTFIRNTPEQVKPMTRNIALAYAAVIYFKAGLTDSAYMYAQKLINSADSLNKETGYEVLLSPALKNMSHPDTLARYYVEYKALLNNFMNDNQNKQVIVQQSMYNYELQKRDKEKAEKSAEFWRQLVFGVVLLLVMFSCVVLMIKSRYQKRIIMLQQALDNINHLKQEMNIDTVEKQDAETDLADIKEVSVEKLRERLKAELLAISESVDQHDDSSIDLLGTEAYNKLMNIVDSHRTMEMDHPLWNEMETEILKISPKFRLKLRLLTSGKLNISEYHTALLVKFGIKPSQMEVLFSRSHGAIISRRESIGIKIFGQKISVTTIDRIIHRL